MRRCINDVSMFRTFQLLPYLVKKHIETNKTNEPLLGRVSSVSQPSIDGSVLSAGQVATAEEPR